MDAQKISSLIAHKVQAVGCEVERGLHGASKEVQVPAVAAGEVNPRVNDVRMRGVLADRPAHDEVLRGREHVPVEQVRLEVFGEGAGAGFALVDFGGNRSGRTRTCNRPIMIRVLYH